MLVSGWYRLCRVKFAVQYKFNKPHSRLFLIPLVCSPLSISLSHSLSYSLSLFLPSSDFQSEQHNEASTDKKKDIESKQCNDKFECHRFNVIGSLPEQKMHYYLVQRKNRIKFSRVYFPCFLWYCLFVQCVCV